MTAAARGSPHDEHFELTSASGFTVSHAGHATVTFFALALVLIKNRKVAALPRSFVAPLVKVAFALAARVVHVDDFEFCVEVERGRALLECADARGLDAAEGDVRFAARGGRVDVRHAGLDLVHEAEDAGRVVREDGRGEPELAVVGDLQG